MKDNKKNEMERVKPVKKRKKIKIGYIISIIAIIVVVIIGIKLVLPSGNSKYGDRLDGIEKIEFNKEEKEKIINKLKENEKVTDASVSVQGKIINILYNVSTDASKEEAMKIGETTLEVISDEVKGFFDLQYMVTKKGEEGKTVNDDVTKEEVTKTDFPIMGYKNVKTASIVW